MKKVIIYISLLVFGGLIFMAYGNLSALKQEKRTVNKPTTANTSCYTGFSDLYFYKEVVANFLSH